MSSPIASLDLNSIKMVVPTNSLYDQMQADCLKDPVITYKKYYCNDGTTDTVRIVDRGMCPNQTQEATPEPCYKSGVFSSNPPVSTELPLGINKTTGLTDGQKWLAVIGITAVCYYILHKAGSLK